MSRAIGIKLSVFLLLATGLAWAFRSTQAGKTVSDRRNSVVPLEDPRVLYFFERGCPECDEVKEYHLDGILRDLGVAPLEMTALDVGDPAVVERLLQTESRLGFKATSLAPVLIVDRRAYCGLPEILRLSQQVAAGACAHDTLR
jgi:hypothetical protein